MQWYFVWICFNLFWFVNSRMNIPKVVYKHYKVGSSKSWLQIRGGQNTEEDDSINQSSVMLRIQFPNGRIEKLEFSPTDPLSTLANKVQTYFKAHRSYFKSYKLSELSLVVQGKSQSLEDLLKKTEGFGSKGFKFGEWITFKVPKASSTVSEGSESRHKGKVHTFDDIDKYKQSLFKFSRKRTKEEKLPKILFPSHLWSLTRNIYHKGGIQLLFGRYLNQTAAPGQYHIVGGYDLYHGNLLDRENISSWLLSSSNITNRLKAVQSILQDCNCEFVGLAICTHGLENNNTTPLEGFNSWNPVMFYLTAMVSKVVDKHNLVIISVLKKPEPKQEGKNNRKNLKKPSNRLQSSEDFSLEGYQLFNQTYQMINQEIINSSESSLLSYLLGLESKEKSRFKTNKNRRADNNEDEDVNSIPLSKRILLGYDDVDKIDISLLSQPLPIQLVTLPSTVIPFRTYFPTTLEITQKKASLAGQALQKFQKQLQSFPRNLLTKVATAKTVAVSSDCLVELRDFSMLEYLSTLLPKGLWKKLVTSFVAYDTKEFEALIVASNETNNGNGDPLSFCKKGKKSKEIPQKQTSPNPLQEKKISKAIQMELSLYLDTLPQEKIRYQGEPRKVVHDDEEEEL